MMAVISLPRADPDATSARNKSPDDKWVKPYLATIFSHCVPLPLPGPPRGENNKHDLWEFTKKTQWQ